MKIIKPIKCLIRSNLFYTLISFTIILNTIVLALDKYPSNESLDDIFERINIVFFVIFLVELILIISGLGFRTYFKDRFNIFDCFVVLVSCIDVII